MSLEEGTLPLAQRAAYRRILAVLKAQRLPFLIVGVMGLSLHLGWFIAGQLEIFVRSTEAPAALAAMEAAGFKVERDENEPHAQITYGQYTVQLAWGLPAPLGGKIDEDWFVHAARTHFVDLRVKVAPLEELLWTRLAAQGDGSVGDPAIESLLLRHGAELDWQRLAGRLMGLEGLLLAHLFLLHHRHPRDARTAVPPWVFVALMDRLNAGAANSVEPVTH